MTPNLYASQKHHRQQQQHYANQYPRLDYEDLFDIGRQVKELDRQLAIVRTSPPKISHDGKLITIQLDMSRFVPQEIEITVADNTITVKAMATVYLNEKNSVDKLFKRKLAFPSNIVQDTVTTTVDRYGSCFSALLLIANFFLTLE
ncbi:unnamed protein product [Gongylonema pulchrum]|uniref:SHSP domain-containing protein n=1 Tax=Gongylonema pulchrum TaxID=637853 RepID=A0A183DB31_9BILA|nr:unnamed protein product [Gongylonema pulchrum]